MTQVCAICQHTQRLDIDRAIISCKSKASIAREYSVSESSLSNHGKNHLSRQLVQAFEKRDALESMNLLGSIETLLSRTSAILDKAESKKNYGIALKAIREMRGSYELLSKIAFSLHQARLSELELERVRSGETDMAEQEDNEKRLKILTNEELDIYFYILKKLDTQDKKAELIIDEPSSYWALVGKASANSKPDPFADKPFEDKPPIRRTKFADDDADEPTPDPNRVRWDIPKKKDEPENGKKSVRSLLD